MVHVQVGLYARHTGHSPEKIEEDIRRPKYFSPEEAVEYGIIDKVTDCLTCLRILSLP
jgi:ATP-dependent protease ClpP protease subunit